MSDVPPPPPPLPSFRAIVTAVHPAPDRAARYTLCVETAFCFFQTSFAPGALLQVCVAERVAAAASLDEVWVEGLHAVPTANGPAYCCMRLVVQHRCRACSETHLARQALAAVQRGSGAPFVLTSRALLALDAGAGWTMQSYGKLRGDALCMRWQFLHVRARGFVVHKLEATLSRAQCAQLVDWPLDDVSRLDLDLLLPDFALLCQLRAHRGTTLLLTVLAVCPHVAVSPPMSPVVRKRSRTKRQQNADKDCEL